MTKIMFLPVLLVIVLSSFGQETKPSNGSIKKEYIQKSKRQQKRALIFLGSGAVLVVTGLVIPTGESTGLQLDPYSGISEGHKNDGIKAGFVVTGVVSMLGSIPFFIASGKNKRRAHAISASLKTEKASLFRLYSWKKINYPALSLKIALN